jgi:hypothetical protein
LRVAAAVEVLQGVAQHIAGGIKIVVDSVGLGRAVVLQCAHKAQAAVGIKTADAGVRARARDAGAVQVVKVFLRFVLIPYTVIFIRQTCPHEWFHRLRV